MINEDSHNGNSESCFANNCVNLDGLERLDFPVILDLFSLDSSSSSDGQADDHFFVLSLFRFHCKGQTTQMTVCLKKLFQFFLSFLMSSIKIKYYYQIHTV